MKLKESKLKMNANHKGKKRESILYRSSGVWGRFKSYTQVQRAMIKSYIVQKEKEFFPSYQERFSASRKFSKREWRLWEDISALDFLPFEVPLGALVGSSVAVVGTSVGVLVGALVLVGAMSRAFKALAGWGVLKISFWAPISLH